MGGLVDYLTPDKPASSVEMMDADFQRQLGAFLGAAPGDISIYSGYRSPERQAVLWKHALEKYGSAERARKWVAPPGHSFHGKGTAADLRFSSPEMVDWAHKNAESFGLNFPLSNENWHIEPIGQRIARAAQEGAAQAPENVTNSPGVGELPATLPGLQGLQASRSFFDPNPMVRQEANKSGFDSDQMLSDMFAGVSPLRRPFLNALQGLLT